MGIELKQVTSLNNLSGSHEQGGQRVVSWILPSGGGGYPASDVVLQIHRSAGIGLYLYKGRDGAVGPLYFGRGRVDCVLATSEFALYLGWSVVGVGYDERRDYEPSHNPWHSGSR